MIMYVLRFSFLNMSDLYNVYIALHLFISQLFFSVLTDVAVAAFLV